MVKKTTTLALFVASSVAFPFQQDLVNNHDQRQLIHHKRQPVAQNDPENAGDTGPVSATNQDATPTSFCVDVLPVRGCIFPDGKGTGNLPAATSAMAKATDAAAAAGPAAGWAEVGIFSAASTSLSDFIGSLAGGIWGALQGTSVWFDGLIHGPQPPVDGSAAAGGPPPPPPGSPPPHESGPAAMPGMPGMGPPPPPQAS